jgi:hypothetical protein
MAKYIFHKIMLFLENNKHNTLLINRAQTYKDYVAFKKRENVHITHSKFGICPNNPKLTFALI